MGHGFVVDGVPLGVLDGVVDGVVDGVPLVDGVPTVCCNSLVAKITGERMVIPKRLNSEHKMTHDFSCRDVHYNAPAGNVCASKIQYRPLG